MRFSEALVAGGLLCAVSFGRSATAQGATAAQPRSIGRGPRVAVGVAAIGVKPNEGSTSAGLGPMFALGYGFTSRLGIYFGFDVAYGIALAGERRPYGKFDILGLRYTHAKRERRTVPFIDLAFSQADFTMDSTSISDSQWNIRLGAERFFTPGRSLEFGLSAFWGTLDDHGYLGEAATVSVKVTSLHFYTSMNFRPYWQRFQRKSES